MGSDESRNDSRVLLMLSLDLSLEWHEFTYKVYFKLVGNKVN